MNSLFKTMNIIIRLLYCNSTGVLCFAFYVTCIFSVFICTFILINLSDYRRFMGPQTVVALCTRCPPVSMSVWTLVKSLIDVRCKSSFLHKYKSHGWIGVESDTGIQEAACVAINSEEYVKLDPQNAHVG